VRAKKTATGSALLVLLLAPALCLSPAWASLSVYVPPERLAQRSTLAVEGTVARVASGYDPATGALATYVTLELQAVHSGRFEGDRLVLREPGGSFGDLVHELDAVPTYRLGERVLVFLEPSRDGALRTTGMFYGKFTIEQQGPRGRRVARRDLDGHGRILGRGAERTERLALGDLVATAAAVRPARPAAQRDAASPRSARGAADGFLPVPREFDRLAWDDVRQDAERFPSSVVDVGAATVELAASTPSPTVTPQFALLNETTPSRWYAADQGMAVEVNVQRSGNPLGDGAAAAAEMRRALDAWTDVPESRLELRAGDDDYDYTGSHAESPVDAYSGINVILFDDPYDDISDPADCVGVLAIGGYWRSKATGPVVNGTAFHFTLQLYVVFNDGFECFLGDALNLAEVGAHELGHGIGLGHSYAPDAIMRSFAYGGRGPRLGFDDRDAVHCIYPHTLTLLAPNGGEEWQAGSWQAIEWASTVEAGADDGAVDLEYSTDDGQSWQPIASNEPNDGLAWWQVPDDPTTTARVRVVRGALAADPPDPFPSICSGDASDFTFTLSAPRLVAGYVSAGEGSPGLELRAEPDGRIRLNWEPSCSSDATDHAIYEGSLEALRSGNWDHSPVTCAAGPDLVEYVEPGPGSRYYLVAPLVPGAEGGIGAGSDGAERPVSTLACRPREAESTCDW
jgi:hypothetical protein